MVGGAAGDDVDLMQGADVLLIQRQILQHHLVVLDAGKQALAQGIGLFHDLLDHEVLIAALLGGGDLPVDGEMLLLHRVQQAVIHFDGVSGQHGDLAVLHIAHIPGMLDDGSDVTGEEVAAVAIAQHQRAVLAGGDDLIRAVHAENTQCIGTLQTAERLGHCVHDVVFIVVVHQLGHHLGVRLGQETDPLGLKPLTQGQIIFDDAIVHHGDTTGLAHMGVRVQVRGLTVGGPAGVPQTDAAVDGCAVVHQIAQRLQAALGLVDLKTVLLPVDRNTCGVIATVLQPGQTLQQNGGRFLMTHKTDDSTHNELPPENARIKFRINTQKATEGRRRTPLPCDFSITSCQKYGRRHRPGRGQYSRGRSASHPARPHRTPHRDDPSGCAPRPRERRECSSF